MKKPILIILSIILLFSLFTLIQIGCKERKPKPLTMKDCIAKIKTTKGLTNEEDYECCSLQCVLIKNGHLGCMVDCMVVVKLAKPIKEE